MRNFIMLRYALVGITLCLSVNHSIAQEANDEGLKFFEQKIRPVLNQHCYSCHSKDAQTNKKLKAELFLDTAKGMLAGGETGPTLIKGQSAKSLLMKALKYDGLDMPPSGKLPENVIADFAKWIDMGAPDPRQGELAAKPKREINLAEGKQWWSFQPLKEIAPPAGKASNTIDRFIQQASAGKKLQLSKPATKEQLLRRAYYDLIGLPPTPEQIDAFAKDTSSGAFEKVVDELLASPRYGEKWARHWLDVARYAESGGYEFDGFRPAAYHYRDWVIRALNEDMPYNQFVKMQLAGDLQIKNYQMRLDLLNKQAELEQQHQDNTQRMFKMAEGLAVSDYQKRKLAEQAAKQELLNLNKKHQIERDILAIQIKMNELALIKSELDQKSAEKKLAAELKVQEAETAKVLKSRTATDEEKKGSLATLDAKKFAYQAKLEERPILEQQAELNRYTNTIQKAALDNKQRNETQDKTVAVAKSTFTTADDRAIYRALMNNLRGDRRELDNTRINFSQEKLSNLFSYPNSNVNLERPNFDSNSGKSKSSNSKLNKDVVINFNPTTNIEVKGNADVKEFSKQLNSESDKWIKGLHETLRRVNTELGN